MAERPASISLSSWKIGEQLQPAIIRLNADQLRILGIPTKSERRRWQLCRTKYALRVGFPDEVSPNLTDKEIQRRIEPIFRNKSWKLPSVDTIARARGRRTVG
jgi:hypothetical protein